MKNPFRLSDDNKRYYTWNYYSKSTFGKKIYKVPLDAGFSCPNRDGTLSDKGCIFCSGGSNAFPELSDSDLIRQYYQRKQVFLRKWPDGIPYAYFQSYSNTYSSLSNMKEIFNRFLNEDDVKGIVIATRTDCLDDEKLQYLNSITEIKPVWIELGLQSIHDKTLKYINRGHDYQSFIEMIHKISKTNLKISVHLINGFPSETKEEMLQSAIEVGKLPIHAVKFHMLHICKGTPLGNDYLIHPFPLLNKEEYVELVGKQLSYLREDIIIERLTGDGLRDVLIAPEWTLKKVSVINDIDKYMSANDLYQGKYYQE